MIVGCYVLDLYCDNQGDYPDGIHEYNEFPRSYHDEFGSKCRKAARRDGWKLNLKEGTAICPKCNEKKNAKNSTES